MTEAPQPIEVPIDDNLTPIENRGMIGIETDELEAQAANANDVPIIFLDIDGPMIPGTQLLVDIDSCTKRIFPLTTIAVINEICKLTGALIVVNSTHNRPTEGAPNIIPALIAGGIDPAYFHDDGQTAYPEIDRDLAIIEWLARHKEVVRWLAIDDCDCAPADKLVAIDGAVGVTLNDLNDVLERWGFNPVIILM